MAREEAIENLNTLYMAFAVFPNQQISLGDVDKMKESVSMAIEALEREPILDKIKAEIKEQIDYHDDEHRKYDSEEEFGISLGLELALAIINKEVSDADSD